MWLSWPGTLARVVPGKLAVLEVDVVRGRATDGHRGAFEGEHEILTLYRAHTDAPRGLDFDERRDRFFEFGDFRDRFPRVFDFLADRVEVEGTEELPLQIGGDTAGLRKKFLIELAQRSISMAA